MIRPIAAIVLALTLTPAVLHAQDVVFTVTAASADVHMGPSTATPVVGHASRGMVLPVARDLGSWARVPWPDAPDGVGYLHVTMGRLGTRKTNGSATTAPRAASTAASRPSSTGSPIAAPSTESAPVRPQSEERVGVSGPQGVTTISHVIGVGGLVAPMNTFGASGRAWHHDRLGVEFRITRNAMTSEAAAGRMTSLELEPRVVYALFDHVSDYVWVRPYLGSGVSFSRHTLSSAATIASASDNHVGFGVFGGTELTFASVTRVGVSVELGYRSASTPFPGFETDRFNVAVAGHWYIK